MLDDFLANRRSYDRLDPLKPVRKPEVLELFDMDEEDEKYFLQAILDDLKEHRRQLGILGWWPIYETHQRIKDEPDFARRFGMVCGGLFAVGVAAFAAFVLPHLPWIGPRIQRFFAAVWGTVGL